MPQVFIPNKGLHDLSQASKFGRLVVLSEGMINQYKVHEIARVCEMGLRTSEPEDYILISGLPIIVGICSAFFAAKHKRVNYLIWNGREYERREIIIGDRDDERVGQSSGSTLSRSGSGGQAEKD